MFVRLFCVCFACLVVYLFMFPCADVCWDWFNLFGGCLMYCFVVGFGSFSFDCVCVSVGLLVVCVSFVLLVCCFVLFGCYFGDSFSLLWCKLYLVVWLLIVCLLFWVYLFNLLVNTTVGFSFVACLVYIVFSCCDVLLCLLNSVVWCITCLVYVVRYLVLKFPLCDWLCYCFVYLFAYSCCVFMILRTDRFDLRWTCGLVYVCLL